MNINLLSDSIYSAALEGNRDITNSGIKGILTPGVDIAFTFKEQNPSLSIEQAFLKAFGYQSDSLYPSDEAALKRYYAYMFFKQIGGLDVLPFGRAQKLSQLISSIVNQRAKLGIRDTFDPFTTLELTLCTLSDDAAERAALVPKYAVQLAKAGIKVQQSVNNPDRIKLMINSPEDVARCFDLVTKDAEIANAYQQLGIWALPSRSMIPYQLLAKVLRDLGVEAGENGELPMIVEVGVGNAENVTKLAEKFPARYLGFDFSAAMFAEVNKGKLHSSIDLALADAARMPIADNSVDVVLLCGVIGHLKPDLAKKIVAETTRVLTNAGLIIVGPQRTEAVAQSRMDAKFGTRTLRAFEVLKDENGNVEAEELDVRAYNEA